MPIRETSGRLAQALLIAVAAGSVSVAGCDDRGAAASRAEAHTDGGLQSAPATADAERRQSPDGRALTQTFSEDFRTLDPACGQPARWRPAYGDGSGVGSGDGVAKRTLASNGERQVYVDACFLPGGTSPFKLRPGGGLDIVADRAPPSLARRLEGHPYTSGVLTTQPSFSQRYGYFEMRARLPRGKGLWPAFWMLPTDLSWPPEIDVVESVGDPGRAVATVHAREVNAAPVAFAVPDADGFHTYGLSWDPQNLVWYLDGREVARQQTPAGVNKPMFLLLDLAVGGHWSGDPDEATPFPARFSIDWVRAYQFDALRESLK